MGFDELEPRPGVTGGVRTVSRRNRGLPGKEKEQGSSRGGEKTGASQMQEKQGPSREGERIVASQGGWRAGAFQGERTGTIQRVGGTGTYQGKRNNRSLPRGAE
jgi:hypothetical protein